MTALPKNSILGILGGGQLGRMTAEAAAKLGYQCHIFAQDADEPACQVTPLHTLGDFTDEAKLKIFAESCDVISLEWENIPVATLEFLQRLKPVYPKAEALKITQDRILEKSFARTLGLDVPEFRALKNLDDAKRAATELGCPFIIKTARMGYDGKGQAVVKSMADVEAAWASLKTNHAIAEKFVPFDMEISVIAARGKDGAIKCFPPVHNTHKNGILDITEVPAKIAAPLATKAIKMAETLAEKLGVVGLLAVEMFVVGDKILMNEMAPRPHNSGHWTMDFCATSQFEQFVRALVGLPLADTTITAPCRMINLIGDDVEDLTKYQSQPDTFIHLYGKKEIKAARKMGHVNQRSGVRDQ